MNRSSMLATAAAAAAMTALPRRARAADRLNVAYVTANDFLPAFVAKDEGIFERHGLDVTLIPQRVINGVAVALTSGSLDIGGLPPTVLLEAQGAGVDAVAIGGISRDSRKNPIISLLAQPSIADAASLAGKKVGVPGLFGGIDVVLRWWLKDKGVPLSAITFVEVPFPQMQPFLEAHQVDAVAAIEPVRGRILAGGFTNLGDYFTDFKAIRDDVNLVVWAASRAWATAHKDQIARFRASMSDAMAWIRDNPKPADAIEVKYLKFAGPHATYSLKLVPEDFAFYATAIRTVTPQKKTTTDYGSLILT